MALTMLPISVLALAIRAFSWAFKITPKIIAARMAMIAMTTSNSMSVNAERERGAGAFIGFESVETGYRLTGDWRFVQHTRSHYSRALSVRFRPPFQGLKCFNDIIPRALPWAVLSCPLRGRRQGSDNKPSPS